MLCLLWDYLQYRNLKGPYGNAAGSLIPDLFEERIPEDVLSILKPGDCIWTGSKRSIRSWLIMYYCQIPVSHITIYLGERRIIHATTDSGSIEQRIDELFDRGLRFLPCQMISGNNFSRDLVPEVARKYKGRPYWYRYVIFPWLYIISGRNWGTFKWKFYLDFLSIYVLLTAVVPRPLVHMLFLLSIIHLGTILAFAFLWKFKPSPFDERGMSLNMFFAVLLKHGMQPIVNTVGTIPT
jgi:hypothetical protein